MISQRFSNEICNFATVFTTKIKNMETFYIIIAFFLLCLAVFDMYTGVSSAVVAFLPPAIGAKAAKLRTLLIIASIGILVGTATSSGMMDIARNGVLQPQHYVYSEVMCVFLAVVCADVIIIDIFNTLGMPTSTTVSMMFELFGGTTALALYKMSHDTGGLLSYGTLVNTDKVLQVIMAIFLSVAIAFIVGMVAMWGSRVVFTFQYKKHMKWSIAIFGGFSISSIMYFLLTKGFGQATFMTEDVKTWIADNSSYILIGCFIAFALITQILHWLKINVFKIIVIFGTFSLAMAFAGNDLVNFIGVALAGLESTIHFVGTGVNPDNYVVDFLAKPAKTPLAYLIASGAVMVIALFISKKARNVINTSLSLSKQGETDEIFSSSRIARRVVRMTLNTTQHVLFFVPKRVREWVNTRFQDDDKVDSSAAFDLVRASINLVLSGLLIVIGTSLKLPLSTTYVAFMVAMGSSLADRAWGRESAVYRITGVMSVVGGWFITAGAAFTLCFLITTLMYFGGPIAMALTVIVVLVIIIRSNLYYSGKKDADDSDALYKQMLATTDKEQKLKLLQQHINVAHTHAIEQAKHCYAQITEGLISEDVRLLRKAENTLDAEKSFWKKQRQKEIVGMRMIEYYEAVKKNTWFHLASNSVSQIIYGLKRMCDPCLEHVDNNFPPLPKDYIQEFLPLRDELVEMFEKTHETIVSGDLSAIPTLLAEGNAMKSKLSQIRHTAQDRVNTTHGNIRLDLLYLNTLQETQELVSDLRHLLRGIHRFNQ